MHVRHLAAAAALTLAATGCGIAAADSAPAGPRGLVIERGDTTLTVAPFSTARAVLVAVDSRQRAACERLEVFPDCLQ
ncbi:hypothetical protein [Nonomuraea sp. NPDC003804]|uniref:hypothetical protein n=1 Tax=Nonomuraea sp. NPDC003804 TaxID=3154547 RepID=UPI0033A32AA9